MSIPAKDPISLAQDALEAYIKNAPAIIRIKRASKNIIAFNKTRGTESPDVKSESDLPQIGLEPIGGQLNINFASNLTSIDWSWRVFLNSGDMRLQEAIGPLFFAVYVVLAHAVDSSMDGQLVGLKWGKELVLDADQHPDGYPFAKNLTLSNVQRTTVVAGTNAGIAGWADVCDLTMHMLFPTSWLRAFNA